MALELKDTCTHVRGLIYFGWVIAAIRFLLEFTAPDQSMYFGVYIIMPLAYLYYGIKGKLDDLTWPRLALGMVIVAFFVWFIPNCIAYTTAQFMAWDHGRFAAAQATPEAAATAIGKIMKGVGTAAITLVGGSVWSIVLSTLLIWLPGRRRKSKSQTA